MARYNSVIPTTTTTTTATVAAPAAGLLTKFTGTAPYTVTIASPTLYAGQSQTFYNATSGTITISAPAGTFVGPGGSTTGTQSILTATTLQVYSDGNNWVCLGAGGGPLTATTGTFSGGVSGITTLSASDAVTFTKSTGVGLAISSTDDSTTAATGSITTAGGVAVNKSITVGKAGTTGVVRLLGSTSGSITMQAPATAGTQAYTLPTAVPAVAGYALTSDLSGNMSWAAAGATVSDDTTTTTLYPTFFTATSGAATTLKVSSTKMSFNASTGTLTVVGITESSSITLKENVNPINNALDAVLQLVGVTYDRRDGSTKGEAGLIAEEVNKVIPNIVSKDKDGNPEGIHYTKLTAYLIESIKSLKEEINQLKGNK
jgi:hypothetical protein